MPDSTNKNQNKSMHGIHIYVSFVVDVVVQIQQEKGLGAEVKKMHSLRTFEKTSKWENAIC